MARQHDSRPKRWDAAATKARRAFDGLRDAQGDLHDALDELSDIQAEYADLHDNTNGLTAEMLSEVASLHFDVEVDLADYTQAIDGAENTDLPTAAETLRICSYINDNKRK